MTKLKEITVKLPQEWVEHLEQLEKTTDKNKDYYVRESLFRYLEDIEDYQIGEKALKERTGITYNSEQATQILKELRTARKSQQNL